MDRLFDKNNVKKDFDNAINRIVAIESVRNHLVQKKKIKVELNKVNIVDYEMKNDDSNKCVYYLVLELCLTDKVNYKLIDTLDDNHVIISTDDISKDYAKHINAIHAIITYFTYNDNFSNIVNLIKSCI